MNLRQLVETAGAGYTKEGILPDLTEYLHDDGVLRERNERDQGDTLGEFIAVELCETFDDSADDDRQYEEAIRVMVSATEQLERVVDVLTAARSRARRDNLVKTQVSQQERGLDDA